MPYWCELKSSKLVYSYSNFENYDIELKKYIFQTRVDPWKIYVMVGIFVVLDIVLLAVWQLADPMQRTLETFPLEIPEETDDDVKIKPQLEHCKSQHTQTWLGKS